MPTSRNYARSVDVVEIVTVTAANFNLAAGNQTAQTHTLTTLPANFRVSSVHVIETDGAAWASTATLDTLASTVGDGTDVDAYLQSEDIKGASVDVSSDTQTVTSTDVSTSAGTIVLRSTPAGTGGDWDTLSWTGTWTFYIHMFDVRGAELS